MRESVTYFFAGEKLGALLAVILGIGTLAASTLIWRTSYRWAVLPLGIIALLHIGVGAFIYLRTDRQVARLCAQLDRNPAEFKAEEGLRMQKIMRKFVVFKTVEVTLLALGVSLALFCKRREELFAIGLGLIWQASVMLIFDLIMARRSQQYLEAIERWTG